jgi:hypothetical protein
MLRRLLLYLGVLGLVSILGAQAAFAVNNPNGYIRGTGWNFLLLTQGFGANGGGPANMNLNWVFPHDVRTEDPKVGDVWAGIPFGGDGVTGARASGWSGAATIAADPVWFGVDGAGVLSSPGSAAEVIGGINWPTNDVVDFQHIVDRINAVVAATPDFVGDNSLALATTYVRNTTGADLKVGIITGSDDGRQLFVNDRRVDTRSDARGTAGDYEEIVFVVLAPGVNRITVLVFEGGGGWGLRCGVVLNGIRLDDVSGPASGVEFLGTGVGDPSIVGAIQGADTIVRRHNPFGWIVSDAWNYLGPLDNPYGAEGGNVQNLIGNWVAPHDIRNEDPKPGDVWVIDFGHTAVPTGHAGGNFQRALGLPADPIWYNLQDLRDIINTFAAGVGDLLPGSGVGTDPFGRGLVDLEDIFRYTSAKLKPFGIPTIDGRNCPDPNNYNTDCDLDNVALLATTYVRNNTGAELPVRIVTASDDTIVAYVNCQLVTVHSQGRGSSRLAQDFRPAVLPPGISKIAAMIVEGGGGFNFRLGVQPANSVYNYADGCPGLEFLGTGRGDNSIVGVDQFCMERSFNTQTECLDLVKVTIQGNGVGDPNQPITLVEHLNAYDLDDVAVLSTSPGGTVQCDVVNNVYTNVSSTAGDIWQNCDAFQYDYSAVSGDFDVAVEIFSRSHSTGQGRFGKFGLMMRFDLGITSRFQMNQDVFPELLDTHRTGTRNANTGGDLCDSTAEAGGSGGTILHPRFMRVTRRGQVVATYSAADLRLADGTLNPLTDANWSRRTNTDWAGALPAEVLIGFANSEHNSRGAARQAVIYRILPTSTRTSWDAAVLVGTDVGGRSGTTFGTETVAKRIVWNTTVGAVNAGLVYKVQKLSNTIQFLDYLPERRVDQQFAVIDSVYPPPFWNGLGLPDPTLPHPFVVQPIRLSGTTTGNQISPKLYQYQDGNDSGVLTFPLGPDQGPVGAFTHAHDIGSEFDPRTPGSSSFAAGVYTIRGSGNDIWDEGDKFQYAYREVAGDFVATVRIANVVNPPNARWGRAGIMARYSCHLAAKSSLACAPYRGEDPPNSDTKRHQSRSFDQSSFGVVNVRDGNGAFNRDNQVVPAGSVSQATTGWVRLVRCGDNFFSLFADDVAGEPGPWVFAGGDYHRDAPRTLLVGLVASAHNTGGANLLSVDYDNWNLEQKTELPSDCKVTRQLFLDDYEDGVLDPLYLAVLGAGAFTPAETMGRLRLTQDATGGSATAVWLNTNGIPLAATGFSVEFDAYYSKAPNTNDPADGYTFAVVQGDFASATALVGDAGGGEGYNRGDHNAIPAARLKGFAVEIDNWDGGHGSNDPPGQGANGSNQDDRYHMGINFNFDEQSGVNNVEYGAKLPPLYNRAMGNHVEVFYNPADTTGTGVSTISAFVTANDGTFPRTKVLEAKGPKLAGNIFMGFTGGTGGASCTQEVDNFRLTQLCYELPDAVTIVGPDEAPKGGSVTLAAELSGADASGQPFYRWSIVSGAGSIVGAADQPTVEVRCGGTGDVVVRVESGDRICMDMASDEHTVSCECPSAGDTHCLGLVQVSGPAGNFPGSYTFQGSGMDDGGQAVSYDFSVDGSSVQSGPSDTLTVNLTEGNHLVSVTVDDNPGCPDQAADATCDLPVTVLPPGALRLANDCNLDGSVDLSDSVCMLNAYFGGRALAVDCGAEDISNPAVIRFLDTNGDGQIGDTADAIFLLRHLFFGGPAPRNGDTETCRRFVGCQSDACP